MKTDQPKTIRLADYAPTPYAINAAALTFDLDFQRTEVTSVLEIARRTGAEAEPLILNGEALELLSIEIDGEALTADAYEIDEAALTLFNPPGSFQLTTRVAIDPSANTRLEGLYQSKDMLCTQCEAEGFRRITYYLDRPDVMAPFSVTLRADPERFPVLLSNGNPGPTRMLEDGRREAIWIDPFPKPAYLFALVAGDLAAVEDHFTTRSGRDVALTIFVEHGAEPKACYAMDALKRSMIWDEERFGLEYDLDVFNIVAISHFNMGAMENKGLNVFNAKYVLADAESASDMDFTFIESIVAHEYFHNWTGNRVTCRDWFQLSLKEGLTVFRDQEFTSDQRSRPVKRIQDVRSLRARQFPEDAGPLAHPVRPESYIEINNFYTATVYDKGAEVIRMMHTLLGEDGFQKGMKLYFERHDGEAATCDQFAAAMADANNRDLDQFKRWYSQAGTPVLRVAAEYDEPTHRLRLRFSQQTPATPNQPEKAPFYIPFRVGLIGQDGAEIPLNSPSNAIDADGLAHLTEAEQEIIFTGVTSRPVLSLNRGFSAPVLVESDQSDADLAFAMTHDMDAFARWEAGQTLALRLISAVVDRLLGGETDAEAMIAETAGGFITAMGAILTDPEADPAFKSAAMALPTEDYIGERAPVVQVDAIHQARLALRRAIGAALAEDLARTYAENAVEGAFAPTAEQAGKRALRNAALSYLCAAGDGDAKRRALDAYRASDNMTETLMALNLLCETEGAERDEALAHFEERWRDDEQVIDKWFGVQAMAAAPNTLARVLELMKHPAFDMKNPNKVRALIGAFAHGAPVNFHAANGSGYEFLADRVIELDSINPQNAARMLGPLGAWRRYDAGRQAKMKAALERILAVPVLSPDSYEIASKSLKA
ncbi:MAG: aminopeptidase N [Alphaproteobacteria bacterium]|nr:aminopeptidase N [Alphaproteobacteria bacterium]